MTREPVRTKRDFVKRYAAGEFGNASPTWLDPERFKEEAPRNGSLFHLRNGAVAGGKSYYKQPFLRAYMYWKNAPNTIGGRIEDWYTSMQIPPLVEQSLLLQGEVMRTERGLYLYYTRVKEPMRIALARESASVFGILAVSLLREALCSNSYDWLNELLDLYPDHVVEFSAYERRWGTLPNFNTVFWEVRNY